MNKRMEI